MNFAVGREEADFAESIRATLAGYRPPPWAPGAALDDHDPELSDRMREVGLAEAVAAGHGFVAAAGLELGRGLAPLALFDEITIERAALAAAGVARHPRGHAVALDLRGDGAWLVPLDGARPAPALDTQGFIRLAVGVEEPAPFPELRSWAAFHTAYHAGLAAAALALAVEHARARVQFGRPLMALAPVQQMLADAAALAQGLELLAWEEPEDPWPPLVHATEAACRVCETAHQVHGAVAFALETPLHGFFRRAHATRLFTVAVVSAARGARTTA